MSKSYAAVAVLVLLALTVTAVATEYQTVDAYKNCIAIRTLNAPHLTLTPGAKYTVTVEGDATISFYDDSEIDGVFIYYYDGSSPVHPKMAVVNKGETYTFTASASDFFAFIVDKSMKDTADNGGFMYVTVEGPGGYREIISIQAMFNCIGLEEFGAAKKILVGEQTYGTSVSGDAATNGDPSGVFDGVCLFHRHMSRPYHPIYKVLEVGEEYPITPHSGGWVYCFLLDETMDTMGNNTGAMTVEFEEQTPVEASSWGEIKADFR